MKKAVFIIVNAGFSEDAIKIARSCGAGGATIINSRGTGNSDKHFLGMHFEPEKEMIISVVDEEIATKIMTEIKAEAGVSTPTQGICFSLSVDNMTTINYLADHHHHKTSSNS